LDIRKVTVLNFKECMVGKIFEYLTKWSSPLVSRTGPPNHAPPVTGHARAWPTASHAPVTVHHALAPPHRPPPLAVTPRGQELIPSCVAGRGRHHPFLSLTHARSAQPPNTELVIVSHCSALPSSSKPGRSTPSTSSTHSTYSKLKPLATTPARALPSSAIFLCETAPSPTAFRRPLASPTTPRASHGVIAPLRPGAHRRRPPDHAAASFPSPPTSASVARLSRWAACHLLPQIEAPVSEACSSTPPSPATGRPDLAKEAPATPRVPRLYFSAVGRKAI
jgi:hypothetical protein